MTTDLDRLIEAVEAGIVLFPTNFPLDFPKRLWVLRANDGSIDAAAKLLEALLPGWGWHCGVYGARVWEFPGDEWHPDRRQDVDLPFSPARALLLATLRAYRSTKEGG